MTIRFQLQTEDLMTIQQTGDQWSLDMNIKQWSENQSHSFMSFPLFVTIFSYLKQTLLLFFVGPKCPHHSSKKRILDGHKVNSGELFPLTIGYSMPAYSSTSSLIYLLKHCFCFSKR